MEIGGMIREMKERNRIYYSIEETFCLFSTLEIEKKKNFIIYI